MAYMAALHELVPLKLRYDEGAMTTEEFQTAVADRLCRRLAKVELQEDNPTHAASVIQECRSFQGVVQEFRNSLWLSDADYQQLQTLIQEKIEGLSARYNINPINRAGLELFSAAVPNTQLMQQDEMQPMKAIKTKALMVDDGDAYTDAPMAIRSASAIKAGKDIWDQWKAERYKDEAGTPDGQAQGDEAEPKAKPEEQKPTRYIIRSMRWICGCVAISLVAFMAYASYDQSRKLLKYGGSWEWFSMVTLPIMLAFFAFAIKTLYGNIFAIFFSSVRAMTVNSEFYSAIPTPILPGRTLPPVTVQVPVYKEDLHEVIIPTYNSVKKAMQHYIAHGGQASMLVCDDGLQLISQKQAAERLEFYQDNNISFVARPPAGRRGIFKKASNMNYTFKVIDQVEAKVKNAGASYSAALQEVWQDMGKQFVAGGQLTLPEDAIILLLDADTRMPHDAITLTMGEFLEYPDLPFTQHNTYPFEEQYRNFFEQLVSEFTIKIYTVGIAANVAIGDWAPLVGHNAFLRWSAMKQVAFTDPLDNNELKYWSENHVSEDFDLCLRFTKAGFWGRYVMYTGTGFQEGVSLTYIDEIIKLRKFAFGAFELVFNKFRHWPTRGIFSKNWRQYIFSRHIPWYMKISLTSYLATFYALSSAPWLTALDGAMSALDPGFMDYYWIRSFDVMLTCTVIFGGIGSLGGIVLRWRLESLKGGSIVTMIWDTLKFVPLVSILFSSAMFPMCVSAACFFFDLKVVWGSTVKEVQEKTCLQALRDIWSYFWFQYVVVSILFGGFVVLMVWKKLSLIEAWGPCSFAGFHLLGPILLDPHIVGLSF